MSQLALHWLGMSIMPGSLAFPDSPRICTYHLHPLMEESPFESPPPPLFWFHVNLQQLAAQTAFPAHGKVAMRPHANSLSNRHGGLSGVALGSLRLHSRGVLVLGNGSTFSDVLCGNKKAVQPISAPSLAGGELQRVPRRKTRSSARDIGRHSGRKESQHAVAMGAAGCRHHAC